MTAPGPSPHNAPDTQPEALFKLGSLFSGYGGLEMAVEEFYGARTAWCSDVDPGSRQILAHHSPDVPNLGDITRIVWGDVEPIDILTGGWPCQPFSLAGLQKGADDERALWPYVRNAVRALRPQHVILENVAAITTAGELARAVGDLAALGYMGGWRCVRAADVGAPHGRARIFIHAVTDTPRSDRAAASTGGLSPRPRTRPEPGERPGDHHPWGEIREPLDWGPYATAIHRWEWVVGRAAPRPTERHRLGHLISPAFTEWMMGLPAGHVTNPAIWFGWTVQDAWDAQHKALGNGVVPQQAYEALRRMTSLGGVGR